MNSKKNYLSVSGRWVGLHAYAHDTTCELKHCYDYVQNVYNEKNAVLERW